MKTCQQTLSALQALCSRREYCTKDMYDKALKALGNVSQAESVVKALKDDGFVDDRRYACAFARDKAAFSSWGPAKIRLALSRKGIGDDLISEALSSVDSAASLARLRNALVLKRKSLHPTKENAFQVRQKLLRFALQRGFSYDASLSLIEEIEK